MRPLPSQSRQGFGVGSSHDSMYFPAVHFSMHGFFHDIYIHLPPTLGVESPIITWSPGHHITLHLRSSLFGTIVIENDETNLVQSTSACGLRWTEDLDLVLLGGSILGAVLLRCLQHIH